MLGRRHPPPLTRRLGNLVWPRCGWKRALRYWLIRLQRLPASPDRLAGGLAIGVATACLPYIGLQFIIAGVASWLVRANVVASAIGTLFANPWTLPLIWWGSYRLGVALGFDLMSDGTEITDPGMQITAAFEALKRFDLGAMLAHAWPVLLPMTVGGAIIGAGFGILAYVLLQPVLAAAQRRRETRLQNSRARIALLRLATKGLDPR